MHLQYFAIVYTLISFQTGSARVFGDIPGQANPTSKSHFVHEVFCTLGLTDHRHFAFLQGAG